MKVKRKEFEAFGCKVIFIERGENYISEIKTWEIDTSTEFENYLNEKMDMTLESYECLDQFEKAIFDKETADEVMNHYCNLCSIMEDPAHVVDQWEEREGA